MKILVTGATGRVGSRLVPALLDAGHRVRILVRQQQDEIANRLISQGAEQVIGDIMKPDSLREAFSDIDVVVHLAAFFRSQDANMIHDVNVNGTRHVAEAALRANEQMRFIFASTNLVYSNTVAPAREGDDVSPARPYPISK